METYEELCRQNKSLELHLEKKRSKLQALQAQIDCITDLIADTMIKAEEDKTKRKEDERLTLPAVLGRAVVRVSIYEVGHIPEDPRNFHNNEFIYPVGFHSKRKFFDPTNIEKKCYYTSKILMGDDKPLFEIASQTPGILVQDSDSNILFEKLTSCMEERLPEYQCKEKLFLSAEDFFGITHPLVKKHIEELPGAERCTDYKKPNNTSNVS